MELDVVRIRVSSHFSSTFWIQKVHFKTIENCRLNLARRQCGQENIRATKGCRKAILSAFALSSSRHMSACVSLLCLQHVSSQSGCRSLILPCRITESAAEDSLRSCVGEYKRLNTVTFFVSPKIHITTIHF